jgi:hypothetical protein
LHLITHGKVIRIINLLIVVLMVFVVAVQE